MTGCPTVPCVIGLTLMALTSYTLQVKGDPATGTCLENTITLNEVIKPK